MANLEQIVLPLEQSRALVEAGIVLDTAISWEKGGPIFTSWAHSDIYVAPAPTLGELLDAIRVAIGDMDAECSFGTYKVGGTLQHGVAVDWVDVKDWEADRHKGAYSSTDLLAAAALLLEVSK